MPEAKKKSAVLFLGGALVAALAWWPVVGRAAPPAFEGADGAQTHRAVRVLRSTQLTVEVMDPDDPGRYNRAERFSPVANVLRVRQGGVDFLHAPDEHDPFTENGGLAMEFDNAKFGPPGFVEAAVGEGFLKIGVGVLRKAADLYHYQQRQVVIEPAKTRVTWGSDRADFQQVCRGVNGYAYILDASVTVVANVVTVTCRLHNTGGKPFATRQYAHNYFTLGLERPEDIELEFPFDFDPLGLDAGQRQEGRTLVFGRLTGEYANVTVPILYHYLGENWLAARHRPSVRAIVATTSLTGDRVFIHATARYLSPEQFVILRLAPGEAAGWSRRYEFWLQEPTRAAAPEVYPGTRPLGITERSK